MRETKTETKAEAAEMETRKRKEKIKAFGNITSWIVMAVLLGFSFYGMGVFAVNLFGRLCG